MIFSAFQIPEHTVIESHPDNLKPDFRLDIPFAGLVKYMSMQDLSSMTKQEHMHTPYLVILYKTLIQWKEKNGGNAPKNFKEKKAFKEMIMEGKIMNYLF